MGRLAALTAATALVTAAVVIWCTAPWWAAVIATVTAGAPAVFLASLARHELRR